MEDQFENIQEPVIEVERINEPNIENVMGEEKFGEENVMGEEKIGEEETETEITIDSNNEKMDIFYKLKQKYEADKFADIIEPILSEKTTMKSKKQKFSKSKPKCVNCKRRVGTIFSIKYNEEDNSRKLIAKCGSNDSPCILNIELNVNPVTLLNEIVDNSQSLISKSQDEMIQTKNNLLFGYITQDDALNTFETLKTDISKNTVHMETHLFKLLEITHNTEKLAQIKLLQNTFYINIGEYKQFIINYERTNDITHIKNANEYYINTILPTVTKLNEIKYALQEIVYKGQQIEDVDSEEIQQNQSYNLIQQPYTIDMLEDTNNKEYVNVSHFKVGVSSDPYSPIQPKQKQKITIKKTNIRKNPKTNTTKKNKNMVFDITTTNQMNETIFKAIDDIIINNPNRVVKLNELIRILKSSYKLNETNVSKDTIKDYYLKTISTGQTEIINQILFPYIDTIYSTLTVDEKEKMTTDKLIKRLEKTYHLPRLTKTHFEIISKYVDDKYNV